MEKNKDKLNESILNLFNKQRLNEGKDIQRVLNPADADAFEQHEEAQKQNAERRDPKNYEKEVKDLIQETASEESRYRHFDVVDRKELAKQINEAKQKGLDFKVSRSNKEGFRYDFKVLNEDFLKKEAGDPDINTAAFNKATDVGASSPATGLGEDVDRQRPKVSGEQLAYDLVSFISNHDSDLVYEVADYLRSQGYTDEVVDGLFFEGDALIESKLDESIANMIRDYEWDRKNTNNNKKVKIVYGNSYKEAESNEPIKVNQKQLQQYKDNYSYVRVLDESVKLKESSNRAINLLKSLGLDTSDVNEELDEDLKVYTSTLDGFMPSDKCKDFWNEIKDAGKIKELEYALETLFDDGISDVALDDMLCHEEDWVRDLIGLPFEGEEEVEVDETTAFEDDEDIEPIEDADYYDDEDIEPIDFDKEPSLTLDDEEEVEEIPEDDEVEEVKDEEEVIEDKKEKEEDEDDSDLAENFIKNNFKKQTILQEAETPAQKQENQKVLTQEAVKESDDDDEVIDVSDDFVEAAMGCPKKEEEKK